MYKLYPLFLFLFLHFCTIAQDASIQFINNSPTLGTNEGPIVDVYINGVVPDGMGSVGFREASSFIEMSPGNDINFQIRLSPSELSDPVLASFVANEVLPDANYTLMLAGVNLPIPQLPDLALFFYSNAETDSPNNETLRVNAIHGGIILPPVSIGLKNENAIFNVSYGNATPYTTLDADELFLFADVQNLGFPLSYVADFRELGGKSATIFISGAAINDPEWGLWVATSEGEIFELPLTLLANVQFVNSVAAGAVDIYIGDELWIDDIGFREATSYRFLPSENILTIGIAPGGSQSVADVYATYDFGFETDQDYMLVLSGTQTNPDFPLDLIINRSDRMFASSQDDFEVNFFHGIKDSSTFLVSGKQTGLLIDSLSYHGFSEFIAVESALTYFDIRLKEDSSLLYTYIMPDDLYLTGVAVSIILSEFPDGSVSAFAVRADGSVVILERLAYNMVQIINNIPGSSLTLFDNEDLLVQSFEYLEATEFIPIPSRINWKLSLGTDGTTDYQDAFIDFDFELNDSREIVFVLSGILNSDDLPLGLYLLERPSVSSTPVDSVAIDIFQGIHGSETVSIRLLGDNELLDVLTYHEFSESNNFESDLIYFDVESGPSRFIFEANLSNYEDDELVLLFSGDLSVSESLRLYGIDRSGMVFELPETSIARFQLIHNLPGVPVDIYFNDSLLVANFQPVSATTYLNIEEGFYRIGIAPPGSLSVNDTIKGFDFDAIGREEYTILVSALPESADELFDVFIHEGSRSTTANANQLECLFHNGSIWIDPITWSDLYSEDQFTNLTFGAFSEYLSLDEQYYVWSLFNESSMASPVYFEADLRGQGGKTCVVLLTENLEQLDDLVIRVVLSDGALFDLNQVNISKVQFVSNLISDDVDILLNDFPIVTDFSALEATSFIYTVAGKDVDITIRQINQSELLYDSSMSFPKDSLSIIFLGQKSVDEPEIVMSILQNARDRTESSDPEEVDVSYHNGVLGSTGISFLTTDGESITEEITAGNFSNYLSVVADADLREVWMVEDVVKVETFFQDLREYRGASMVIWTRQEDGLSAYGALADGTVFNLPAVRSAKIQVLHNAPQDSFDVYLYDKLFIENIAFRTGTSFLEVPAGFNYDLSIRRHTDEVTLLRTDLALEDEGQYIVIANGIPGNIIAPLEVKVIPNARLGSTNEDFFDMSIFHGAPDTDALTFDTRNFVTLAESVVYYEHRDYVELLPQRYIIDLKDDLSGNVISSYEAFFNEYGNSAGLLFASGVADDAAAEFGLFLLLGDGEVVALPIVSLSRVQFINNALSESVDDRRIDLYYGGEKLLEALSFRSATGFLELPAFADFEIGIAPAFSESEDEVFYSILPAFENAQNYIIIATGVIDSDDPSNTFSMEILSSARRQALLQGELDLILHHGSPDIRGIDVLDQSATLLIRDIRFREYSNYLSLNPTEQIFSLELSGSGESIGSYLGDFNGLSGQSITLFVTGEEDADLGLWAALANGLTFPLELIVNTVETKNHASMVSVFPNPFSNSINISLNEQVGQVSDLLVKDLSGKIIRSIKLDSTQINFGNGSFFSLDLSGLLSGSYFIQLVGDNFNVHKLIIKE